LGRERVFSRVESYRSERLKAKRRLAGELLTDSTGVANDRFGREARIAYQAGFGVEQPFRRQLSRRVELQHLADSPRTT